MLPSTSGRYAVWHRHKTCVIRNFRIIAPEKYGITGDVCKPSGLQLERVQSVLVKLIALEGWERRMGLAHSLRPWLEAMESLLREGIGIEGWEECNRVAVT